MPIAIKKPYRLIKPTRLLTPNLDHKQLRDCNAWWPFLAGGLGLERDICNNIVATNTLGTHDENSAQFRTTSARWTVAPGDNPMRSALGFAEHTVFIEYYTLSPLGLARLFSNGNSNDFEIAPNHGGTTVAGVRNNHLGFYAQGSFGWTELGPVTLGQWHKVLIRASATQGLQCFIDGDLVFTSATNWTNGIDGNMELSNLYNGTTDIDCNVRDLRCFTTWLDDAQVHDLFNNQWAPFDRLIAIPVTPSGPQTITGTGALQAQDAAASGLGTAEGAKDGAGALEAQDAAVGGQGSFVWTGSGALDAQSASANGSGAIVQEGTGALQAQDAAAAGIGELGGLRAGSGALQAQDAAVSGAALRIPSGTGDLQAQDAAVNGLGTTSEIISGTGVLQAQTAIVDGQGLFVFEGAGTLQAQDTAVIGSGFQLGDLTLTAADLAAIQDAVWAKLVNEGLVAKIDELWQRRGLDAANPQTYDKAGNQIRVGNITIDLAGDQNAITQTRQP